MAARNHPAQAARLIPELYRAALAERKARELAAIQAIVATVSQAKDAKSLAKRAMETILELMHLEIGGLALYDPHKHELVSTPIIGLPPELVAHFARIPLQEGSGIVAQVAQTGRPLLVTDVFGHYFSIGNSPQVIENSASPPCSSCPSWWSESSSAESRWPLKGNGASPRKTSTFSHR